MVIKPPSAPRKRNRSESGQAVVEYILMVVLALGVAMIIAAGFRRSVFSIWGFMAKKISAPCPSCPADPGVDL